MVGRTARERLGSGSDELDGLEERLQPQAADAPGQAAGREDVVRAGRVVAHDRRRAEKHRSGVPHACREGLRVLDQKFEVLRGQLVRAGERLVQRLHQLDLCTVARRGRRRRRRASCSWSRGSTRRRGRARPGPAGRRCTPPGRPSRRRPRAPRSARPADRSRPRLETRSFASVTQRLPGPTILATGSISPCRRRTRRSPVRRPRSTARRSRARARSPSIACDGRGVATAIRSTPASRAGTAVITSDETARWARRSRRSRAAASGG